MEVCCALCDSKAAIQCDSDQAMLCLNCDEKIHSANFLVAKHSRVLLCSLCHSLTQWKASGPRLTQTFSLCHSCFVDPRASHALDDRNHHCSFVDDDGEYSSDDGEEEEDEVEDEEGENQVVPMSSSASATSPPSTRAGLSSKRLRDDSFSVDSHDETGCSSSGMSSAAFPSSDYERLRATQGASN